MTAVWPEPGDIGRLSLELPRPLGKLLLGEDEPDVPAYGRDRTPLEKGSITTAKLRQEFFGDPALPMLVDDDVLLGPGRRAVEQDAFVYCAGEFV